MKIFLLIAQKQLNESWRGKMSYIIFVFQLLGIINIISGIFALYNSPFYQEYNAAVPPEILQKHFVRGGWVTMSCLWESIFAILAGLISLSEITSNGEIYLTLSRPIARIKLYFSKYLGTLLFLIINILVFNLFITLADAFLFKAVCWKLFFSLCGNILIYGVILLAAYSLSLNLSPAAGGFFSGILILFGYITDISLFLQRIPKIFIFIFPPFIQINYYLAGIANGDAAFFFLQKFNIYQGKTNLQIFITLFSILFLYAVIILSIGMFSFKRREL